MTHQSILALGLITSSALISSVHAQQNVPADEARKPPVLLVKNIKGVSSPLAVQSVDIKVNVVGSIAETTLTMVFKNDTSRVLSGELVFPLGEGRTISGYALEVNGRMRQGVVVPKELGRRAYENTIRRQIDPGLAEWTKGNNFRTRIYPIPANGTKKVSISFEENLMGDGKAYKFRLPLSFDDKIQKVTTSITGLHAQDAAAIAKVNPAGLNLKALPSGELTSELKEATLERDLQFSVDALGVDGLTSERASDGKYYFHYLSKVEAPASEIARPDVKSVTLVWDASHSGGSRDHKKELLLIKRYLSKSKVRTLKLQILRDTLVTAGEFEIGQFGDGFDKVEKVIKALRYDGATRLGLLDFTKLSQDAAIVVSDGVGTLGSKLPQSNTKPVFTMHASKSAEHGVLRQLGKKSGGAYMNLAYQTTAQAVKSMLNQPYSLLSVKGDGVDQIYPSSPVAVKGGHVSVTGIFTEDTKTLTFNYGVSGKLMKSISIPVNKERAHVGTNQVSRLWAQKKLAELELESAKNEEKIRELATSHSIVTRYTSLLVLDRLEDYVRYGIAPPEKDLKEQYEQLVRAKANAPQEEGVHLEILTREWKELVAWHKKKHLTAGDVLLNQDEHFKGMLADSKKLAAKLKAKEKLSEAEKKALADFDAVVAKSPQWSKRVVAWKKANPDAHDGPDKEFLALIKEMKEAKKSFIVDKNRKLKPKAASAVGGDVFSDEEELVAPAAGGGAGFAPVPMAMEAASDDAGSGDGFGGAPPEMPDNIGGAVAGSARNANGRAIPNTASAKLAKWDPNTPYLKALRKAAKEGRDLEAVYFEWKAKNLKSSSFYLDVADFFFKQKQPSIALRILSNVAELDVESPALLRILGHRYDQLGQLELAELVFTEVLRMRQEEPQSFRDLALVLEKKGELQEACDLLWSVVINEWDGRLKGIDQIALTELNAILAKNHGGVDTSNYDKQLIYNVDTDIRIALTWDADNTDIDLWVIDPLGQKCSYSKNRTATGGHMSRDFTQGYGPEVFMLKNAMSGTYKIQANYYGNSRQNLAGEVTLQAKLITNWGRPNEKRKAITLRLKNSKEVVNVGTFEFTKPK